MTGRARARVALAGRRSVYARANTLRTVMACHRPPRAVGMPRALSVGNLAQRTGPSTLHFSNDRKRVGCEARSVGLNGRHGHLACLSELRAT